jgi:hypothetical protein
MIHRQPALIRITLLLAFLNGSCVSLARSDAFLAGRRVGIIRSDLVREASGIVASRRNPGVLWIHNDSGDASRIYAINTRAELLGVCNVQGAHCRDWEDIALGPGPEPNEHYLYIGDIGDNRGEHPEIIVYRVPEPRLGAAALLEPMTIGPAEAIRLTYPDGARDAETLLLDPLTRDIYIISKRELRSKVYRAAFPQSTTQRTEMKRVATMPWGFAVAGDVSPDGGRVIVRGMFNASLWVRPAGEPVWRAFSGKQIQLPLIDEPQGEGICFDNRGAGYFTIGEMDYPPLHYFAPAEPNAARHE